jgi:hypothetical protein
MPSLIMRRRVDCPLKAPVADPPTQTTCDIYVTLRRQGRNTPA